MEDIIKVTFSPEAMEILDHCLNPPKPTISLQKEMELLGFYRSLIGVEEAEYWNQLDWNNRLQLFYALDIEEQVACLSLRTPEDLKELLVSLTPGYLFTLKMYLVKSGVL